MIPIKVYSTLFCVMFLFSIPSGLLSRHVKRNILTERAQRELEAPKNMTTDQIDAAPENGCVLGLAAVGALAAGATAAEVGAVAAAAGAGIAAANALGKRSIDDENAGHFKIKRC